MCGKLVDLANDCWRQSDANVLRRWIQIAAGHAVYDVRRWVTLRLVKRRVYRVGHQGDVWTMAA